MQRKTKWDKEYATSFLDEVTFLKSKDIRYTWVYKNECNISVKSAKSLAWLRLQK